MVKGGLLSPLDMTALLVCEPCLEEKMTMRPLKAKGYRAKEILELVHTDLCGPMSTSAREGYDYCWFCRLQAIFFSCAWLSQWS